MNTKIRKFLESLIFSVRWILYPVNVGLVITLFSYVIAFLINDYRFLRYKFSLEMEPLMVILLDLVDAGMVANLIVMVVQGGHQIFIHKFELEDVESRPQWIDHIDSGILKVKIALSIAGITLIQILRDFVNIMNTNWVLIEHRIIIHITALFSAFMMSLIWRMTHPNPTNNFHRILE